MLKYITEKYANSNLTLRNYFLLQIGIPNETISCTRFRQPHSPLGKEKRPIELIKNKEKATTLPPKMHITVKTMKKY